MLGALAEVVDDFLQEYRQKQIKTDKAQLINSKKTAIQADNQLKILKG